jgi:murein DD-endopeptidase MepM/ murein hydrolase activator NlpD
LEPKPLRHTHARVYSFLTLALAAAATAACTAPADTREQPTAAFAAASKAARDIVLQPDRSVVSARVAAGATLASLLHAQQVATEDIAQLVARAGAVFDLRKFRANQPYRLERASSGMLRAFEYEIDGDRFLRVSRHDTDGLEAGVLPIPKTRKLAHVRGEIDGDTTSLVAAMDAAGETIDLTLALADVLGGEIDFSTEVQPGDRFDVSVDKEFREGEDGAFSGYGPIIAVEFVNAGRHVRAVRFTPDGGQPGYYDEHGVSMKRFFLASPLKFNPVVTSAFSRSRLHPVLKEYRAHLGVDYRAAAGSAVVAVADGLVVAAGVSGGAGRMVHLRHANGFESEYLHLSSIAVRAGTHVQQGTLVGRVGSTGLATAAHLDYRLKKNGVFINPVTAHRSMPPADPVPAAQMTAFETARDAALASLRVAAVATAANPNSTVR